jgi:hypothetical protein
MAQNASQVYRDFVVDGVPSSGPHKPSKPEIRSLLTGYERLLGAGSTGAGSVAKATRNDLYSDLSIGANIMAWVYADLVVEYNAIYRKIGAAGTGSWEMILPLPYSFIVALNDGTGDENAIHAVTEIPVSDAALIILAIAADNTASPVTVSFNGGAPLPIKSNTGNDIVAGGLVEGMQVLGVATNTEFRILNDQVSTAIIAQAESAATDAETYKNAALAAVPNAFPATLAALKALPTTTVRNAFFNGGQWQFKAGNYSAQITADTFGGIYAKADDTAATAGAWVRVFDGPAYIEWFGGDANGVADNAPALTLMKNLGLTWIRGRAGNYKINSPVSFGYALRLDGEGYNTHFDCSAGGQIRIEGTISALPNITANLARSSTILTFASAHGLADNDLVLIFNPTADSWFNVAGRNYRAGEFVKIYKAATTTTAGILGRLYDAYTAASVSMYKVNALRGVRVDNCRFTESTSGALSPLYIKYADGVVIENVWAASSYYAGMEFDRCYDVSIIAPKVRNNSPSVGDEYGISLASVQLFSVTGGGGTSATRHAISLGQYDEIGSVCTRGGLISGMNLQNWEEAGAADMHGCVEDITYDNCIFRNGAHMQGFDVTIRNSTIYRFHSAVDGYCIYGSEVAGGSFTLENCRLETDGALNAFGAVYLEGGGGSNNMRADLTFIARNNTIVNNGDNSGTKFFYIRGNNTAKKIDIVVDGLVAYTAQLFGVVVADDVALSSLASNFIVCDNITCRVLGGSNKYYVYPSGDISTVKTRQNGTTGTGGGAAIAWP